jgi:Protein of unknown function (DUF3011)
MSNNRWVFALAVVVALVGIFAPQSSYARPGDVIRCESRDYRQEYCSAWTGGSVRLVRQTSNSDCIEGRTWGYDRRGVWVSHGCAGDFELGGRGGGPREELIVCRSDGYRQDYCRANYRRGVKLVRQISEAACVYGRSWGYDRGGIWVSRGCAAEFSVY